MNTNYQINEMLKLARNNAYEGLDQKRVSDYEDNLRDSLAELFPNATANQIELTMDEFYRTVRKEIC